MSSASRLETLTRAGFAARGIMYGLIGYLALKSGRTEDGAGVLEYLAGGSGRLLVGLMALGFFGFLGAALVLGALLWSQYRRG